MSENQYKTPIQLLIEFMVTDGRNYQTVPYTKLLGQKRALKQWLVASKVRYINCSTSPSNKTPFRFFLKEKINNFFSEYLSLIPELERIGNLERKVDVMIQESS